MIMEEIKVQEVIKDWKLFLYARKKVNWDYRTPISICDINISEEEKQKAKEDLINELTV